MENTANAAIRLAELEAALDTIDPDDHHQEFEMERIRARVLLEIARQLARIAETIDDAGWR